MMRMETMDMMVAATPVWVNLTARREREIPRKVPKNAPIAVHPSDGKNQANQVHDQRPDPPAGRFEAKDGQGPTSRRCQRHQFPRVREGC